MVDTHHQILRGFCAREKCRVLVGVRSDWKGKHTDIAIHALSEVKEIVDVSIIK